MSNLSVALEFEIGDSGEKELLIKVFENDQEELAVNLEDLLDSYISEKFDSNDISDVEELNDDIIPELEDVHDIIDNMLENINTTISSANELAESMEEE